MEIGEVWIVEMADLDVGVVGVTNACPLSATTKTATTRAHRLLHGDVLVIVFILSFDEYACAWADGLWLLSVCCDGSVLLLLANQSEISTNTSQFNITLTQSYLSHHLPLE